MIIDLTGGFAASVTMFLTEISTDSTNTNDFNAEVIVYNINPDKIINDLCIYNFSNGEDTFYEISLLFQPNEITNTRDILKISSSDIYIALYIFKNIISKSDVNYCDFKIKYPEHAL